MITLDELKSMNDAKFNRAIAELAHEWHFEYRMALVGPLEIARAVVDYAEDINTAWALLCRDHLRFGTETLTAGDECHVNIFDYAGVPTIYEVHEKPARALATAWAAWKLAQEAAK